VSRRARPGQVWYVDLGYPVGSEQAGRRPAVVVSSRTHCSFPIEMAIVVPCTSVDRGLPHHVAIDWKSAGLDRATWVRTDDVRSVAERRFTLREPIGQLLESDLAQVRRFVRMMIED
jgi:mRNA interferase MazF